MMELAIVVGLLVVTLPPPICRGKVVTDYDPRQDRAPSPRALAEVKAAYDALCPKQNCGRGLIFQNPTLGNNAVTWVSGLRDGSATTARIVYGPGFLDSLDAAFGAGASFGVLAHEVGHHLTAALSVRMKTDSSWDEELRADYLAGCALGRSGRSPEELEHALMALAQTASPTHPSFARRVPAVRKGYDDCRKDAPAVRAKRRAFGFGELLHGGHSGEPRCWRYAYQLVEDVERQGPIAAPKRRSGSFPTREDCQAHRARTKEEGSRIPDGCACE